MEIAEWCQESSTSTDRGPDKTYVVRSRPHYIRREDENDAHNDMEDEEQEDELGDLRELDKTWYSGSKSHRV